MSKRERRLDGSFWRKRLQHEQVDPSSSDEEDAGRSASRRRRDGGLFATRHGDIVENEYGLEKPTFRGKRFVSLSEKLLSPFEIPVDAGATTQAAN
ncbi:hypothetical protein L914_14324 [Phytophthora nicotianae]|uniref:Uncharacterized protein n=2 Tax=Phytophthora nicotianae TaxID=4792 RepID=V9ELY4_PHYNI|nr:hypothetical protein F443_14910 [Phytophthora nicotianae P1569]ETM39533.1 hypothetical protein L914_14324 [Phytophthora nicotianae]